MSRSEGNGCKESLNYIYSVIPKYFGSFEYLLAVTSNGDSVMFWAPCSIIMLYVRPGKASCEHPVVAKLFCMSHWPVSELSVTLVSVTVKLSGRQVSLLSQDTVTWLVVDEVLKALSQISVLATGSKTRKMVIWSKSYRCYHVFILCMGVLLSMLSVVVNLYLF